MAKDQSGDENFCDMPFEWCTIACKDCHTVSFEDGCDRYVCSKYWIEVLPKELDLTPGVGQ
jgi:hypothetical protein